MSQPQVPPPRQSNGPDLGVPEGDADRDAPRSGLRQQTEEVGGHAREEVGHLAGEAKGQARDLADDARQQLQQQGRQQTERLAGTLEQFGSRVHALAEGRPDDAGPVTDYAERIADRMEELSRRVDDLGFDGVVREVQAFARRRPGAFLLGAAVAGFAVSRVGRGMKDASPDDRRTQGEPSARSLPAGGHLGAVPAPGAHGTGEPAGPPPADAPPPGPPPLEQPVDDPMPGRMQR